jgi:predicted short-subunit dehydrogenase-like oxidoreductase (DUF2520 family)
MIRVVIIGAGNLAIHLAKGLDAARGAELLQYCSRSGNNSSYFPSSVPRISDLKNLKESDVCLIAVKDDAIRDIGSRLKAFNGLVVHTAGSIPLDALEGCFRRGVFYPVQTFSKERTIDWSEIPLALETARHEDMGLLRALAATLTEKIFKIDSEARKKLHLAAVFANNFSNHMFTLSKEVCIESQLPFELLKPLIRETAKKVTVMEPEEAQTGPARRRDELVMTEQSSHLDKEKKEIYSLLSESIAARYAKDKNK